VRAAWALTALALAVVGCAEPTDLVQCSGVVDVGCDGGVAGAYVDDASGAWVSSPWAGPHLAYPKFTTLRLCHGLGRTPTSLELYAAFSESGNLAQQIGSAATVIPSCDGTAGVNERSILIRNGGGQDFFARIVLRP
jgi:hypothetical protein